MGLFTLFASEKGSCSPGIALEMRAFTGSVISSFLSCCPLLLFVLLSFLNNELQLWLPTRTPRHLVLVTCFLYGVTCYNVIMPGPGNLSSCTSTLLFTWCICVFLMPLSLFPFCLCIGFASSPLLAPCLLCSFSSSSLIYSSLPLLFPWDDSGSCLLFLLVASPLQIVFISAVLYTQNQHSRCPQHIALYLSALLSAI